MSSAMASGSTSQSKAEMRQRGPAVVALLLAAIAIPACGGQTDVGNHGAVGGDTTTGTHGTAATTAGVGGGPASCGDQSGIPTVTIHADEANERLTQWSVGYWTWAPSYGDPVDGSEELIAALKPQIIRIGGYNNDANVPDPFDHAELDAAAEYAAATGAELILQLPLIATVDGDRPSAADAAETIAYANVESGYRIQFVSIGNEPDLYPDQGGLFEPTTPAIADYTPEQYCAEAELFVEAVRKVDPTVQVVGPDLGYKYQSFADWLTPILEGCGELFDIVAIHRYPFESLAVTGAAAKNDMDTLRATIGDVRQRMADAGFSDKPLAITEANLAYIASATGNPDGSILGTVEHALWMADFFGVAAELDLWTASIYDIADPDEFNLGLLGLPPERPRRPTYHAIELAVTPAGSERLGATSDQPDLRAYASREKSGSTIHLALVHWGASPSTVALRVENEVGADLVAELQVPALSVNSITLAGTEGQARTYGRPQHSSQTGPEPLELTCIEEVQQSKDGGPSQVNSSTTGGTEPTCELFPSASTCVIDELIFEEKCFSIEQLSDLCSTTHLLSLHTGTGGSPPEVDPIFVGDGGTEDCPSAETLFWGDAGDPLGCYAVPSCRSPTLQRGSQCCYHVSTSCRLR